MTVETHSLLLSSSETAKTALRSMTRPDLNRELSQRLVFPETEPQPQEPTPVRWPRIFPSL